MKRVVAVSVLETPMVCPQVDKLHYILYIKDIPSAVARNAELALFKRNPDEVCPLTGVRFR